MVITQSDWRSVALPEIAEIVCGGTPSTSTQEYWEPEIDWVTAKDISECALAKIDKTERRISRKGLEESSARMLPTLATVLIARGATMGKCRMIARPMALNQTCYGIVAKENTDSRFLFYILHSLYGHFRSVAHGTVFDTVIGSGLRTLQVAIPSLDEQIAIGRFLGALDDKIELNQRMNETLEAMARAIFKSWFVDFDPVRAKMEGRWKRGQSLPGLPAHLFDLFPNSFQDSPLGKIPKGWDVKGLDEVADFLNGLALQKFPPDGEDSLPVIKIAQLRAVNTKGADRAGSSLPPEYIVEDGDVLFSWSGSLEVVVWCGGRGALNQHLFKVTSQAYPKWFYYHWIREHLPQFQAIAAGKATTMGHIQRHHLSEAMVVAPNADLLSTADRLIGPLFQSVIANEIQSRTLAAIRDTLLPKLMSGELRVKAAGASITGPR